MTVILLASLIGGLSSALRYHKQGCIQVFRIFISSSGFAFFGGEDLTVLINSLSEANVSVGFSCFLLAYVGSTLLDRFIIIIRAFRVSKKWES